MNLLRNSNLHQFIKWLKTIKADLVDDLPNYANYGLFYENSTITTGLIDNAIELKLNLIDGNFSYYDAMSLEFNVIQSKDPQFFAQMNDLLNSLNINISVQTLTPIDHQNLSEFKGFADTANMLLEQLRSQIGSPQSQIYLWDIILISI